MEKIRGIRNKKRNHKNSLKPVQIRPGQIFLNPSKRASHPTQGQCQGEYDGSSPPSSPPRKLTVGNFGEKKLMTFFLCLSIFYGRQN